LSLIARPTIPHWPQVAKEASAGGTLPCAIVWRARRKLLDLTTHWISAANAAVAKARRSLPSEPLSKCTTGDGRNSTDCRLNDGRPGRCS